MNVNLNVARYNENLYFLKISNDTTETILKKILVHVIKFLAQQRQYPSELPIEGRASRHHKNSKIRENSTKGKAIAVLCKKVTLPQYITLANFHSSTSRNHNQILQSRHGDLWISHNHRKLLHKHWFVASFYRGIYYIRGKMFGEIY